MGMETFNYFKTKFYFILICLQSAISWYQLAESKKKKKKRGKSELVPVKTVLKWYLSIWLTCFDYTKQLNLYHSSSITHLVIFVKKNQKIRIYFYSSTRRATKISINLKIVVDVSQCQFPHYKEGTKQKINHTALMSNLRQRKPHPNTLP